MSLSYKSKCFKCEKEGHIADVCRSKKKEQKQKQIIDCSEENPPEEGQDENFVEIQQVQVKAQKEAAMITVRVNGVPTEMEIDTGAAVTILPVGNDKIKPQLTTKQLKSATGQKIDLAGEARVEVRVNGVKKQLTVYLVKENCPALFGRNWQKRLTSHLLHSVREPLNVEERVKKLQEKYADSVFKPGLGKLKTMTAHLQLKENVQPKFCKPRTVPYAVKPKLEAALDKMVEEGN